MSISVRQLLMRISKSAPVGFVLGFDMGYVSPGYVFSAYPKTWLDIYDGEGLVVKDPAVGWAFNNIGWVRWSDLKPNDPEDVLARASEHGLRFGATVSLIRNGARVMGGFARSDREFAEQEIETCEIDLATLYEIVRSRGHKKIRSEFEAARTLLSSP